ncbi:SGNH/GDSL hydrolase family protein [Pontiellaceae bacterium B12219]|nr:SGNH/GDSL hydrolase family protein [Pontiellaceae bacterium B12219]
MNDFKCTRIFAIYLMATLAASALTEEEFYTPSKDLDGLHKKGEVIAGLPNVLLIGDSISIGYTLPVMDSLKGMANVQRPGNCGNTTSGLKKINGWLGDTKWDVIHFNFGLHDLCYRHPDSKEQGHRDKVNGKVSVPLGKYKRNLEALVQRMEQTGATLIWASTTPIPEGEAGRIPGDELKYNAAAEEIMKQHGIAIDDLYAVAVQFAPSLCEGPGNVHFSKKGSALLGAQVTASITSALKGLSEKKTP